MKETANHLREVVSSILPLLQAISEDKASQKPAPEKWSPKEIMGHLIDSAANNHQKFVRGMKQEHNDVVGYEQNFWVESQQYNAANWSDLLALWQAYNLHLAHIIEKADAETLSNTISIDGSKPFTLKFIMKDYAEHLKHHILQILPDAPIQSAFIMVY
jgi:hypothetical protein